jgi:tripartite-type tricarboxylate transporter receptor subunit TctC
MSTGFEGHAFIACPLGQRRQFLLAAVGAALAGAAPARAQAPYPARPLTLVVPFAAGGTVDTVARALSQALAARLGQPVLIENVPGAGANIGAAKVAASAPDGYTVLLLTTAHTINPSIYRKPGYTLASFEAVGAIGDTPCWLFVGANSPYRTLAELVAAMKARPGALSYGSGGSGTTSHLATELFKFRFGLDAKHIPYKSSPQVYTDLIAGTLDFGMNPVTGTDQLVKGGRLRALAVAAGSRVPAFPDVPTFAEAGFPGIEVLGWYGLAVPRGVPRAQVALLSRALRSALDDPTVRTSLEATGSAPRPSSSEEFARQIQSEAKRWGDLVTRIGATVD